jgi:pimeloyl-ACP methyl ester carboxylesterase
MFPDFIPSSAAVLDESVSEATSIAMLASITRLPIPIKDSDQSVGTAIVHQAPASEPCNSTQPIVLLHGFDSSLLEFRRLLPRLAAHHPTWAIDLLGFGFTDRQNHDLDFSPAAIKAHLYETWKTHIQRPMVLVGASMGGAAAIDFALTYPEAVSQLVLIDAAGLAKGPAISGVLSLFPAIGKLATNFLSRPKVRRQVSVKAYHDPATYVTRDAETCAALHLAMPGWSDALIRFTCSGGYNFLGPERIAQMRQPTLILWGRQDKILGTRDADRFAKILPQSQLVWIENCGHVPHLEQAEITAAHLLDFIQTASPLLATSC